MIGLCFLVKKSFSWKKTFASWKCDGDTSLFTHRIDRSTWCTSYFESVEEQPELYTLATSTF